MADLDELRIRINADSGNAQRSIDALIQRLSKLSTALGSMNVSGLDTLSRGVNNLNTAMNGLNGQANDSKAYRQLANNLKKLGNINSAQLGGVGASLTSLTSSLQNLARIDVTDTAMRITELSKSISKLGGANATRAITNIPQIATAVNQMITTFQSAPMVNRNIIDLANSMANLAAQSHNVRTATNTHAMNFNLLGHSARNVRPHINGLASAFGRFYASCFLAIRGVKGLWSAIEKSMDYIEVVNYFDAAMEQMVANADLSKWEKLGYDSAQAYAQSFGASIKDMATLMTGYAESATGMLVQVQGAKSLGLNATQLLGASTNFAQIASSMGVATENAAKLSKVLTELGADIASVKNQDFTSVWQNLQSGMVGMSRAVDKYGINIRNANLQAELMNIGITTAVNNLGQEEKALIRVITMLNSTEFAYGDLADTIKQPANQVRMLKASFENFSRSLGNIFLPIVSRIIPYLTVLTNALARLNEFIVSLLGFSDFNWGSSSALPDVVSDALDAEDALDGATGSANKLKKALQGFDELNNITSAADSGGGKVVSEEDLAKLQKAFDEAVERYQKRWDEAFANMSSTYNSFADDIANAFKKGGAKGAGAEIAKKIVESLKNINWVSVKGDVSAFFRNMAQFFNGFINPELFGTVASTVAESLNTAILGVYTLGEETDFENIGLSFAEGVNTFFEDFDWEQLANTIDVWIQGLWEAIKIAYQNINWDEVFDGIGEFFSSIDLETVEIIVNAVSLIGAAKLIETGFAALLSNVYVQQAGVVVGSVVFAWTAGNFIGNQFGQMIAAAINDSAMLENYQNFTWFGEGGFFEEVFGDYGSFQEWWENQDKISQAMVEGSLEGNPVDAINLWLFGNPADKLEFFKEWWSGVFPTLWQGFKESFEENQQWVGEGKFLTEVFGGYDSFSDWWADQDNISRAMFEGASEGEFADMLALALFGNRWTLFTDWWNDSGIKDDCLQLIDNIEAFFNGEFENIDLNFDTPFFNFFSELGQTWTNAIWGDDGFWMAIMHWWGDTVKPFFSDAGSSIWTIIKDNLNNIIDGIENFCNKIIDGIDSMIGQIVGSFKIDLPDYMNTTLNIPDFTVGAGRPLHISLKRLAEGGIATSSTIANIGEAGKEAVLPLERNTGWMDSLAERLVSSMNQQGGGGTYTFVAELDGNTLFEETVRQNDMWRNQTGRNAFA